MGMNKKSWFAVFRPISFSVLLICYFYISADLYGQFSKKQIKNQDLISIRFADNELKRGKMIGKTREIIFLLDGKQVKAIPITSLVKEFDIK